MGSFHTSNFWTCIPNKWPLTDLARPSERWQTRVQCNNLPGKYNIRGNSDIAFDSLSITSPRKIIICIMKNVYLSRSKHPQNILLPLESNSACRYPHVYIKGMTTYYRCHVLLSARLYSIGIANLLYRANRETSNFMKLSKRKCSYYCKAWSLAAWAEPKNHLVLKTLEDSSHNKGLW